MEACSKKEKCFKDIFNCIVFRFKITAIVDYITPDAFGKCVKTIEGIHFKTNNLITVVGYGGDRDKTKDQLYG